MCQDLGVDVDLMLVGIISCFTTQERTTHASYGRGGI